MWGDTIDQVSDPKFFWMDWQGLSQYQGDIGYGLWGWQKIRQIIHDAPNSTEVRRLYCANAYKKDSEWHRQICDKSLEPCDGGFFWCNFWKPLIDQTADFGYMLCSWITGVLGDEKNPWFMRIAAYVLKPVCWLLGKPDLALTVAILGGAFIILAPFIETGLLLAK